MRQVDDDTRCTRVRRASSIAGYGKLFVGIVLAAHLAACDDPMSVRPDPTTVDAKTNPPLLAETMNGAATDFNFAYDIWMMGQGIFGNEMNSVSFLRWEMANRIPNEAIGVTAGTNAASPNDREVRANFPAWYSYVQAAIAGTTRAMERLRNGSFPSVTDPENSAEMARLTLYRAFEIIWLADVWCDFVLDGQPVVYTSRQGWDLARTLFEKVLTISGASASDRTAANAGLARVHRLLGNWTLADQHAAQVGPTFTLQTTYAVVPQANVNRIWFHLWSFGEHTVSERWRNVTLDGTTTPDPRVALTRPPISPTGSLDQLWAPNKVPASGSSLNVTSGVEALLVRAEAALAAGNLQLAVDRINAVRLLRGVSQPWTPPSLNATTVRDKLIDERGRTLLFEGVRVADLRFYLKTYGVNLWHTTVPQGAEVGNATCHPLHQIERDNIAGITYTYRGDTYVRP